MNIIFIIILNFFGLVERLFMKDGWKLESIVKILVVLYLVFGGIIIMLELVYLIFGVEGERKLKICLDLVINIFKWSR